MRSPLRRDLDSAYLNSIRFYRRRLYLRTKDLAAAIGHTPSSTGGWERGWVLPRLQTAFAIAAALQCPVEILYLEQFQEIRKVVRRRAAAILENRNPKFRSLPYWHEDTQADAV